VNHRTVGVLAVLALLSLSPSVAETDRPAKPAQAKATPSVDDSGWTKPVNGIRATAFAVQSRVRLGQAAHLVVLFQNVSDKRVTLPPVHLMPDPALGLDDHPYGKDHPFNAIVVQSIPSGNPSCILWERLQALEMARSPHRLQPGQLLALSVTLRADPDSRVEALRELLLQTRKPEIAVIRRETGLLMPGETGQRDLELVFRPSGFHSAEGPRSLSDDAAQWRDVEFHLPPVRIRIYDPKQPLRKLREQE